MADIVSGLASAALLYFGYKLYPWNTPARRQGDDAAVRLPRTHDVRRGFRLAARMRRR